MEKTTGKESPKSNFEEVIKTGVLKTKHGDIQVWDPEFWENPSVWKAPDGTFVPTISVITTALYLGTVTGTGLAIAPDVLYSAAKYIQSLDGHAKAADLITGINTTIINETIFEAKRNVAIQLCSFFTGVEMLNIVAALKFRKFSKDDTLSENIKIQNMIADMETDDDTKGLLKAVFVRNYLEKCFTDIRRRKANTRRDE